MPACASGIYDTNQATLDRIAAGEMPFMENGADELLPQGPRDRPARLRLGWLDDRADREPRGRHRHPGRRVPRAIDDDLREGRRPDLAASPRRRPGRPAEHGLSGHDRLRRPAPGRAAATAWTWPSARNGSPRAMRSRSSTRCRRSSAPTTSAPPSARRPCSGSSPARRSGRRPRKPSSRSCSPTPGAT